jgi:hypothetical protein
MLRVKDWDGVVAVCRIASLRLLVLYLLYLCQP